MYCIIIIVTIYERICDRRIAGFPSINLTLWLINGPQFWGKLDQREG